MAPLCAGCGNPAQPGESLCAECENKVRQEQKNGVYRMNHANLARAIRLRAEKIDSEADHDSVDYDTRRDDAELLRCLARILSGLSVKDAFGAPGDWGYGTPIGDALCEDYAAAGAAGGQRVAPADVERVG